MCEWLLPRFWCGMARWCATVEFNVCVCILTILQNRALQYRKGNYNCYFVNKSELIQNRIVYRKKDPYLKYCKLFNDPFQFHFVPLSLEFPIRIWLFGNVSICVRSWKRGNERWLPFSAYTYIYSTYKYAENSSTLIFARKICSVNMINGKHMRYKWSTPLRYKSIWKLDEEKFHGMAKESGERRRE